jgi:hypothetical protein
LNTQEAVESLRSRHNRLQELSQSSIKQSHIMRGIVAEMHAQAIGIYLLLGQGMPPDKPSGYTLEDALHYLERRRVHLATKVLGNTEVPHTSRVKCWLEREAILLAESAVKAEIGREMVRSMRDVV